MMRVKIYAKEYGIPEFKFGHRYFVSYPGCTYGEEFVFTRKRMLELGEYDEKGKKVYAHWMSKKSFKECIHLGLFLWIGEFEEDKQ